MANAHRATPGPRLGRSDRSHAGSAGDAELIDRVREGDAAASAELWRRHAPAARSVARAWSTLDADDLVSEAFLRTLDALARGGGPDGAFRPYLFTSVRNVASSWGRRGARERPLEDDVATPEDGPEERALAALDRDLGVRAFRALPARWREVLWYTAVEGMSPAEAAPLLGLRPNGVAALGHRAREGLRGAWIQEHVAASAADGECRWVLERAGAHTRGRLPIRDRRRADAHLATCESCRAALAEAAGAGARLAMLLLPLAAGVGGAAAYGAAGGAAGASAGAAAGASASGAGASASGAGASVVGVSAGAGASASLIAAVAVTGVVTAGLALAALLPPAGPPAEQQVAVAPVAPVTIEASAPTDLAATPDTVASPTPTATAGASPSTAVALGPQPVAAPAPAPAPRPAPEPSAVVPEPGPTAPVTAVPSPVPTTTDSPRPTPTASLPATPAPTPSRTPTPTPTPSTPTPAPTSPTPTAVPTAAPPTLALTADPSGRLLPDAHGTAAPGAVVTVEDAAGGAVRASTRADADGTWSIEPLPLPPGATTIVAVSDGRSAPVTVRLQAPRPLAPATASAGDGVPLVVLSATGQVDVLVDGVLRRSVSARAPGFTVSLDLAAGEHRVGVRYASSDGRYGAEATTRVRVLQDAAASSATASTSPAA
ncbi:hypothetical protein ASF48_05405 [Rathayibacter sp. Leaf299]|uniref:sigma-70 family RNA polymerase sigma factor n=1 Tax=Rathayibacter sp. Leaf299 TaxID=1736328 RepID=UPI0006F7FC9C|nr:sigma-70 family RNA polymerase sigma factor [Rathayibacter sp. Leaf299]KQQ22618.1 hypothetical protein ASF48_05405 [Rathayibacter sp. Leaf299]